MERRRVVAVLTKLYDNAPTIEFATIVNFTGFTIIATEDNHATSAKNIGSKVANGPAARAKEKDGAIASKNHLVLLAAQKFSAET